MLVKTWPMLGSPPQSDTETDDCDGDHRSGVQATERFVLLLPAVLSCHDRAVEDFDEPAKRGHISKMVLPTVETGSPKKT